MPIALLKFPNDFLREVFRLCDPFDLYKLSKCSKTCSQKATMLRDTKKWKIGFSALNNAAIWVDGSIYYFNQTDNPEDYFKTKNSGMNSTHMDVEFPIVDLFIYLVDTFGIRIVRIMGIGSDNFHNVLKVAQVLIDRRMEIESFRIFDVRKEQDVVNFMPLMKQMNIIQEFKCFLKFPPNFHFEFVKYPRHIYIDYSSWFTIDQLLDCTSAWIDLEKSSLNNHDLDVFLQKWKKKGTFPNLRWLEIGSEKIDDQSPILEMIPPIKNVTNPRKKVSINGGGYIIDGVRATKDDGTEGWLKVELGGWPILKFLVADPADTVMKEEDDW
ncbi:hypothetical protein B9Z55_027155 [Caenorhabditis nigoni]|nr:hypothetical protein B9Z55_027155 [Caenorhabditis nigoni]